MWRVCELRAQSTDGMMIAIHGRGRDEASLLVRWCQENLTDRQFRILYGRCVNGSTLEDMAKGNGLEGQNLTRERVRQIEEKALEKIHRYYPGRGLCQA